MRDFWEALRLLPPAVSLLYWFFMGAVIGSFLNVCIYRLPRGENLVFPRSRCPQCRSPIPWYRNIPLISWLFLRGHCADCNSRISFRYFFVELWTALTFLLLHRTWGWSLQFLTLTLFACFCIVLFFIDWEHQILPDVLTLPGIVLGMGTVAFNPLVTWKQAFAGLAIGLAFPLFLIWGYWLLRHEEGMGFGDVKLMGMLGAILGFRLFMLVVLLSALSGLFAGALKWSRSTKTTSFGRISLPFGTFLCGAAWFALLWGSWLIERYQALTWKILQAILS